MWFLSRKSCACEMCGNLFVPPADLAIPYKNYCALCRKPLLEIYYRKQKVMNFIENHWQEFEEEVLKKLALVQYQYNGALGQANIAGANAFVEQWGPHAYHARNTKT